jgi:hypothetical protein
MEDLKVVATGRGLNLAAMRTKQCGIALGDRTRPASKGHGGGINYFEHDAAPGET